MQTDKPITIVVAVALSCIGVLGMIAAPMLQNALQTTLSMSPEQTARIVSAEIGGAALASLLATTWIGRVNWKIAATFAVLVVVGVNVLTVYQTDATSLTVMRFLAGFLGEGTAYAVAISIINSYSSNHSRAFGFFVTAQTSTIVLAFLILPGLTQEHGLQGLLFPVAAYALLVLPLAIWVPAAGKQQAAAAASDQASVAKTPIGGAIFALVILFVWTSAVGAIWTYVVSIGGAAGLAPAEAGRAIAISTTLAVAGGITASILANKGGQLYTISVALIVQIVSIALLQGEMNFVRFTATVALFQFFWNFTIPFLMGLVSSKDTSGRISIIMPAVQNGAFAVGPVAAGFLLTEGSFLGANYYGIASCAVALIMFVALSLQSRQPAPAPNQA